MSPAEREIRRVAIVHEWFTGMRGGEKCVEALCEVFPDADVFALLHVRGSVSPVIERAIVRTSFVQHLPAAATQYRRYLPLFPLAVRRFDLRGYDLVISSNHCVAKGARVPPGALHICYCYTPMRYIWSQYDEYFGRGRAGLLTRGAMRLAVGPLRRWDIATAAHPRHFVAISENVRTRIREIYGRESDMIYPPVDTSRFTLSAGDDAYYLIVSALVPYKALDIAIQAFNRSGDRLVIVGNGPDAPRLQKMAGPNVSFEGWQSDDRLRQYYARCRAVIFPGEEDFGIVPVEAMATGKPVLAFARGGALETVIEKPGLRTGVLFPEHSVGSLLAGLAALKSAAFDPALLRAHALTFDRELYKRRMKEYCVRRWEEFALESPQVHD
jgi:glycosyltransferase involved in cell wall biosynthesis